MTKLPIESTVRSNGFEVISMNSRKPMLIIPITESTRATMLSGRFRLKKAMAALQAANRKAQSNREPSWAPQTAEILYISGNLVLPCWATYSTVKSSARKALVSTAMAIARNTSWPQARERDRAIQERILA